MEEKWKTIPEHDMYEVSDRGNVRSYKGEGPKPIRLETPKMLRPSSHTGGYLQLIISDKGERYRWYIHRLVLEVFTGTCPPGKDACHNDGVRTNNNLENLRWDSRKGNLKDTLIHGTHQYGEAHGMCRLTDEEVLSIRTHRGWLVAEVLAETYSVHRNHISKIWRLKTRDHLTPRRFKQ